ncbi:hypothetical protein [Desulfosediminicola ganghwensis]|uniref:hypothetical protein n=1 Tax=Desulfosediminicola ganghwensis TaxID=2569540 RepID=UPI0010AC464D|nr:hypothetical protein [Desulfosediminicola ganghwensis]
MSKKSAEKPQLPKFSQWLNVDPTVNGKKYLHVLLTELSGVPDEFWQELVAYIDHAHQGARNVLRAPLGDSLSPVHYGKKIDPAFGYPHKFDIIALQGFFGEILTGIIAEHIDLLDDVDWEVPVYLFRAHTTAFQQLEEIKNTGEWGKRIMGRTGDDGLAFARDEEGNIVSWMACEAKCTRGHSAALINDNHEKLSKSAVKKPVDLLRTIKALEDYADDDYAKEWIDALRKLYFENGSVKRYDFSVYVCGRKPVRETTWIPTDKPHTSYAAKRKLNAAEIQILEVVDKIKRIYKKLGEIHD